MRGTLTPLILLFACSEANNQGAPPAPCTPSEERCDGEDNDCNGLVDDVTEGGGRWYLDLDADGHGTADTTFSACAQPVGYSATSDDCDDADPRRHEQHAEACDGVDNDCDDVVDEDASFVSVLPDLDGDGFGAGDDPVSACAAEDGEATEDGDCDDLDAERHPGATERCDGFDDDCDGSADEGLDDSKQWAPDLDHDGWGETVSAQSTCAAPPWGVEQIGDCNDGNPAVHPGTQETCGGADEDCDGLYDVNDPDLEALVGAGVWWIYDDADRDGWGRDTTARLSCSSPQNYWSVAGAGGDCDDNNSARYPRVWASDADGDGRGDPATATSICGAAPEGLVQNTDDCDDTDPTLYTDLVWYRDFDGDGYGRKAFFYDGCNVQPGRVRVDGDCGDQDEAVHPGATEICNGVDDNCTGGESDTTDGTTYYRDADGDGAGDPATTKLSCDQPSGWVATADDCDDRDDILRPGAQWFADLDGDGLGDKGASPVVSCTPVEATVPNDADCDDADPDRHDLTAWYADVDEDGAGAGAAAGWGCEPDSSWVPTAGDCDDRDDESELDCTGLGDFELSASQNYGGWQKLGVTCEKVIYGITPSYYGPNVVTGALSSSERCFATIGKYPGYSGSRATLKVCGHVVWDHTFTTAELQITTPDFDIGDCSGCTDHAAFNYDPTAKLDDGSCLYIPRGAP
jgi:hypothetical protein